jgi:proteic killer suppression protein
MIRSFGDERTHDIFHGLSTARVRRLSHDVVSACMRRLDYLEAAHELRDLRCPPGNRLEALSGDRSGFYSIRVNDQWRLVFRWEGHAALDVQLVDYH